MVAASNPLVCLLLLLSGSPLLRRSLLAGPGSSVLSTRAPAVLGSPDRTPDQPGIVKLAGGGRIRTPLVGLAGSGGFLPAVAMRRMLDGFGGGNGLALMRPPPPPNMMGRLDSGVIVRHCAETLRSRPLCWITVEQLVGSVVSLVDSDTAVGVVATPTVQPSCGSVHCAGPELLDLTHSQLVPSRARPQLVVPVASLSLVVLEARQVVLIPIQVRRAVRQKNEDFFQIAELPKFL